MLRLLTTGLLAAAFFSSTFVLNRAMSLGGGHWVWSASLRYLFMLLFLAAGWLLAGRGATLGELLRLYRRHFAFWTLTGTIGFGLFYAPLCFSASYAPGWVVATSWQVTILATPLVLLLFGRRPPLKALAFAGLIFVGILLVNYDQAGILPVADLLAGGLPVLLAACAYPLGNQLVWEAHRGGRRRIPTIDDRALDHPFARIFLLSLGSLPFWLLLILLTTPPPPSAGQWLNTALVALLSGLAATGLFFHARHRAENPYQLTAVDATQSGEVIFSLLGEVLFLGGAWPGLSGAGGLLLVILGLTLYLRASQRS